MRWLITWLLNAATLMLLPHLLSSVHITNLKTALLAALVLGLLNTVVRPLLVVLTLPVTILTLGLFVLVINGLTFWLAAQMLPGLAVNGLGSAMLAALLYSILSTVFAAILLRRDA